MPLSEKDLQVLMRFSSSAVYRTFGHNEDLTAFYRAFMAQDEETRQTITRVAHRLDLVDDPLKAIDPPLSLYLLCTCIDALSSPHWLDFRDWLLTKKEKYGTARRDARLADVLAKLPAEVEHGDLTKAIRDVYKVYKDSHGIGVRFGQFFEELPEAARQMLVSSYLVLKPPKHWAYPEHVTKWFSGPQQTRLESIAEYLFTYRRNRFTHNVEVHPAQDALRGHLEPEDASVERTTKSETWTSLTFFGERLGDTADAELHVLVKGHESFLLSVAIICYARKLLGFRNDAQLIEQLAADYGRKRVYWNLYKELQANWETYQFYTMDCMAFDIQNDTYYCGIPCFRFQWLATVMELTSEDRAPQSLYWLEAESCRTYLQQLNEMIGQFNEVHLPLYASQDGESVEDRWGHRQNAKHDLITHHSRNL